MAEHTRGPEDAADGEEARDRRLNRRQVVVRGAQGALAIGAANLLAACGGSGGGASSAPKAGSGAAAGGSPVRGGTMRVGIVSGGPTETLNPGAAVAYPDITRSYNLFDRLFDVGPDITPLRNMLAVSAEPNSDATLWTIRLRDGVTWHDGKPLTADDLLWTLRSWSSPENFQYANVRAIDFKKLRKRDSLTVEIPLLQPVAQLPSLFTLYNAGVIQDGSTPKQLSARPVGTGPFKLVSFKPGQRSVFAAHKDYWEEGKPYVDELVIDSSFTSENARVNALLSGQIDVAPAYDPTFAKSQADQVQILRANGSQLYYFPMRVDKGPFTDPRVRQAMKLLVDREAMVKVALNGFGTVANDLVAKGTDYYADSLKRERDVEKAKALLKAAGQENLSFAFPTAPYLPGVMQACTLFAEQAKDAGVKVDVQVKPAATYFATSGGFLTRPISVDNSFSHASLTFSYGFYFLEGAPVDESHWSASDIGKKNLKLANEAIGTLDKAKAKDLWFEVQKQQFDDGGFLVFAAADYIDAAGKNVGGLKTTAAVNLNNYRFCDGWIGSK